MQRRMPMYVEEEKVMIKYTRGTAPVAKFRARGIHSGFSCYNSFVARRSGHCCGRIKHNDTMGEHHDALGFPEKHKFLILHLMYLSCPFYHTNGAEKNTVQRNPKTKPCPETHHQSKFPVHSAIRPA